MSSSLPQQPAMMPSQPAHTPHGPAVLTISKRGTNTVAVLTPHQEAAIDALLRGNAQDSLYATD